MQNFSCPDGAPLQKGEVAPALSATTGPQPQQLPHTQYQPQSYQVQTQYQPQAYQTQYQPQTYYQQQVYQPQSYQVQTQYQPQVYQTQYQPQTYYQQQVYQPQSYQPQAYQQQFQYQYQYIQQQQQQQVQHEQQQQQKQQKQPHYYGPNAQYQAIGAQQNDQQHKPHSQKQQPKSSKSNAKGPTKQGQASHINPPGIDASDTTQASLSAPKEAPAQSDQIWYCEPCDKEFTQIAAFTAHNATHEKCQHPGCNFLGTRKVISAHFLGSHGMFSGSGFTTIDVEGQQFRVLMGTSPEEVQQWRADRRKNFPTAVTVQCKLEQMVELQAAGGLPAKQASVRGNKRKRVAENQELHEDDSNSGEIKSAPLHPEGAIVKRSCEFFMRGKCKRGTSCSNIHDNEARKLWKSEKNNKKKCLVAVDGNPIEKKDGQRESGLRMPEPLTGGSRGTLMKKLLENEISIEENVILQCFRYFVENKFLQNDLIVSS